MYKRQIILSWQNASNTGGLTPAQYQLSYTNDSAQLIKTNIMYNANSSYSQTITGLTNKKSYTFSLFLITGSGNSALNGQVASISASPSGNPIFNSIILANKTLSAQIDSNGSNLLSNFIIVSYDSNNLPSVQTYITPSSNDSGIYSINQLLLPTTVLKKQPYNVHFYPFEQRYNA